ncbi:glyoxalase family protein [Salsuginibacillus halophilus]|uniref:Glyoxalase family protein n=1 Tax=Salsuginibacillus halophilus TaxID=517424 RepID=A0A2P8HYK0_9BACI|nr:glyoxalase family protein [Salsuginibacillus halophilus]
MNNLDFYVRVLGMRLIKKTVNQDDPSVYHLFYGDEQGSAGTELTFFEIPNMGQKYEGTNDIAVVSLRVPTDAALTYWRERFETFQVPHESIQTKNGRAVLPFQDFEGHKMELVSDELNDGVKAGVVWGDSKASTEHGITGLGPIQLKVKHADRTARVLTEVLGFKEIQAGTFDETTPPRVFSTGQGGTGAEVYVYETENEPMVRLGRGGVHHVAFRVTDEEELRQWIRVLTNAGFSHSGFVDRHYFRSLYFREANGILFELATDGPGFAVDEDAAYLGEALALPPFLEDKRASIEARLTPLPNPRTEM